jgi:hypothetical protein
MQQYEPIHLISDKGSDKGLKQGEQGEQGEQGASRNRRSSSDDKNFVFARNSSLTLASLTARFFPFSLVPLVPLLPLHCQIKIGLKFS